MLFWNVPTARSPLVRHRYRGWRGTESNQEPTPAGPSLPGLDQPYAPAAFLKSGRAIWFSRPQFIVERILAAKQQPARYLVHDPDDLPNNVITVAAGRIYAEARDVARALAKTEAFKQSSRDRKRVEMLFAHLNVAFRGRQDRC